jgi:membrane-bound acyltransferase YfiQ involved in biofilm formation
LDRDYRVSHLAVNFPVAVALFNYYVFFLGMIAAKNYEKLLSFVSRYKYLITGAILFLTSYLFWQGKTLYYKTYNIGAFYSQWRPSVLIYTVLFALIAFYFFEKTHFGEKYFKNVSKLSFFVFFAHVIILEGIWKYIGPSWKGWFDLPFFILVSGITFFMAFVAHKIKYLNRLTG